MTQPLTTTNLEELLEEEIPCAGVADLKARRGCGRPAALRSQGHGCKPDSPYWFKCIACWQAWYSVTAKTLAERGYLRCSDCERTFSSVEAFSDFRPF